MAKRVQDLAREIVDRYDGDTARLWTDGDPDGAEVLRRLRALPGFGEQKAKIFLALLGKQYGVTPPGWQAAAGTTASPAPTCRSPMWSIRGRWTKSGRTRRR